MCEQMSGLLRGDKQDVAKSEQIGPRTPGTQEQRRLEYTEQLGAEDAKVLRQWYTGYCESCRGEQLRLGLQS